MFNFRSWLHDPSLDFILQHKKQNMDNDSIYEEILQYIKKNVDFNSASLLLFGRNRKKLTTVAQYGEGCNLIKGMNFKMGAGLSAWLIQKKKYVCLSNIHRGARHGHNPVRSYIAIPIMYNDAVIGILNLAHITPDAFGLTEVKKLQNLTQAIAPQIYDIATTTVVEKEKQSERHYSFN